MDFHIPTPGSKEMINYDFEDESNYLKWKNLFVNSLRELLLKVHSGLSIEDGALIFVESLIFKLIRILIVTAPHNIADLEERISKVFPPPMSQLTTKASSIVLECFESNCTQSGSVSSGSSNTGGSSFLIGSSSSGGGSGGIAGGVVGSVFNTVSSLRSSVSNEFGSNHDRHHSTSSTLVSVGRRKRIPNLQINYNNNNTSSLNNSWLQNCMLVTAPIIERVHELLSREVFHYKIDLQLIVYLCSIIEYIATDILKLSGNYVRNMRNEIIRVEDVKIAMNADQGLMDLFDRQDDNDQQPDYPEALMSSLISTRLPSVIGVSGAIGAVSEEHRDELLASGDFNEDTTRYTYNAVVQDLIQEEKQFIRDFELIIKVFRDPFIRLLRYHYNTHQLSPSTSGSSSMPNSPTSLCTPDIGSVADRPLITEDDIYAIFSNIQDVHEFSVNLLGLMEDTLEMNEEGEGIGMCFEETAENADFDVFDTYVRDMFRMNEGCSETYPQSKLHELLRDQAIIRSLDTGGHRFSLSVKYILPKLLMGPVVQCLLYFELMRSLKGLCPFESDRECFEQCEGVIKTIRTSVETLTKGKNLKINEGYLRLPSSSQRSKHSIILKKKLEEMSKIIEGLDVSVLEKECNEFIYEGFMYFRNDRKTLGRSTESKLSERYCFLFDTLMIACKPIPRDFGARDLVREYKYKYKERFYINKIEVAESDYDQAIGCSFGLMNRLDNSKDTSKNGIVMITKTAEERSIWISNLLFHSRKTILERTLDSLLAEEKKKNPLRLPSPSEYKFAEEDSSDNIIYESNSKVIRGATLTKLIEKLTVHQDMDIVFVKTFLITYRSFCSPQELLQNLIERFDIPLETATKDWTRENLKKFKADYYNVVQIRVINVIKSWLDSHFYDFERDPELLDTLKKFLLEKVAKTSRNRNKFVGIMLKKIEKNLKRKPGNEVQPQLPIPAPPIEYWLYTGQEGCEHPFSLMTVHPLEFGRQLTLYEFDLYRAVKPSELVGLKWTKTGKEINSPNLLRMCKHSNNFTFWLEKEIVETHNLEERIALVARILEILQVLADLNNFNGILEIVSALESASVHRLEHTFGAQSAKHKKLLEEMGSLNKNHSAKYCERLRSINPPCVPFFGLYQTQILHLEEGNYDYIDAEKTLINFSKRRKIAEICTEIQIYQDQPYNFTVCPDIREFLENLNPIGDGQTEKDFTDYLYKQSLIIEPRGQKPSRSGPKRWPNLHTLKSPGIKPSATSSMQSFSFSHSHSGSTASSVPIGPSSSTNHSSALMSSFSNFGASNSNPTSPTLSPRTPPSTTSDTSVFANVIIGNAPTSVPISPPACNIAAPPLPPRRINAHHQRTNSESSVISSGTGFSGAGGITPTSATGFPAFSPTSLSSSVFNFNSSYNDRPPPPPRSFRPMSVSSVDGRSISSSNSIGGSSSITSNSMTIPPLQSLSNVDDSDEPPPLPPKGVPTSVSRQTLPRRNSTESHSFDSTSSRRNSSCASHISQNLHHHANTAPVVPPRTYKSNK